MEPLTCPRHPSAETYLRCSACEEPICLGCAQEAPVGYQCPACAGERAESAAGASTRRPDASRRRQGFSAPPVTPADGRLSPVVGAKALGSGIAAAAAGGLLLGPVLNQGFFFLITAGAIGWAVAHGVFFGTGGVTSPFVRAAALACGGLSVAVGMATISLWDPVGTGRGEIAYLAYPAALYGAWITVRNRIS